MIRNFLDRLQQSGNPNYSQVQDFFFPNPDATYRGVPSYSGGMGNPYAGINPYQYSYMDPKENPGDKLFADLIRAQTQDYLTRFAPIENFLASEITATGTKALAGDLQRTRDAIDTSSLMFRGQ